jgi:RecG-like helicase
VGVLRRWLARFGETDEERLAAETRAWADSVARSVRIADAPHRQPVTIAGIVRRITVLPVEGAEALEALIADGTGEVTAVFMGRRGIGGLTLGSRVVAEGVLSAQRGEVRMVNPRLEFAR